ncbi:MAG: gliding motility-associated C-terminal domain-containing protein [Bacteroidota bacterium]
MFPLNRLSTPNTRWSCHSVIVLLVCYLLPGMLNGQIQISTLSAPDALVACGPSDAFTIYMANQQGDEFPGGTFTIQLPPGMQYAAGSANGAVEINVSNNSLLQFSIAANASVPFHTLSFEALIDCAFTNTQAIQYIYESSAGTATASAPPLSNYFTPEIVPLDIQNTTLSLSVGQQGVRSYTIVQARPEARIDSLFLVATYDASAQMTSFNLGQAVGSAVGSDTLVITGAELPGGDGFFDYNDQLVLEELVTLLTCTSTNSQLEIFWRCNGSLCQSFVADGLNLIADGSPNITITNQNGFIDQAVANDASQVGGGFCETLELEYLVENDGAESFLGAGTAFDLTVAFGLNNNLFGTAFPVDIMRFPNWSFEAFIGNTPLPLSAYQFPAADPLLGYNILFTTLTADPDGAGGLDDLDGDGFFDDLPVNGSTMIRIAITYDANTTQDCTFLSGFQNTGGAQTSFRIGFNFLNQCGGTASYWYGVTDPGINIIELFVHRAGEAIFSLDDENLEPGNTTFLNVVPGGDWSSPCAATDSFVLQLVLPEGLQLGTGASGGPLPYYGIVDNTDNTIALAAGSRGGLNAPWRIPITIDCASTVFDSTLEISFQYFCDPACPDFKIIDCQRTTLDYLPQCQDCTDGISTTDFELTRLSLGWQDVWRNERVDPILNPNINLKAGINFDSVLIQMSGRYGGGAPFDSLFARLSYQPINQPQITANLPHFEPIAGEVQYFAADGSITTCPFSDWAASYAANNNLHFLDFGVESLFEPGGCLEAITRAEGDSIVLSVVSQVTENVPIRAESIPELTGGFYTTVEGRDTFCNELLEQFVLEEVIPKVHVSYGQERHFGCNEVFFTGSFINNHGHQLDGDQFPDEIRSISEVQSVRILIEGHWYYQAGSSTIRASGSLDRVNGSSTAAPGITAPIDDPVVSFDGTFTVLTYDTPELWPAGDLVINGSDPQHNIRFRAIPSCSVPRNQSFDVGMEADLTKFTHAPAAQQLTITESRFSDAKIYEQQTVGVNLISPQTSNPVNDTVQWAFQLENLTNYAGSDKTVYNNWIAIEAPPGVEVIALQDITDPNNPITYPVLPYPDNNFWFQVGDLPGFGSRDFELIALFEACTDNTIQLTHGFSCEAYPEPNPSMGYAFADDTFSCATNSLDLAIRPGEIALAVDLNEPNYPVPLCVPLNYTLDISNLQISYAYDLNALLTLPEGMTLLESSVRIEYPAGSGNLQTFNNQIFLGDRTWEWSLFEVVEVLKGLRAEPENALRLYFQVETNCDFLVGRQLQLEVSANSNCDFSDERRIFSLPILIEGIPAIVNQYDVSLDFPEGGIRSCANSTLTYSLTNLGPFQVSSSEQMGILLPSTLDYVPGSLQGIHNAPTAIAANTIIDQERLLTFQTPAGLAPGDSVVFSITVQDLSTQSLDCGFIDVEALALVEASIDCPSAAGGACEVFAIANTELYQVPVLDNPLVVSFAPWSSPGAEDADLMNGIFYITNTADYPVVNDEVQLIVFEDDNGNGQWDNPPEQLLINTTISVDSLAAQADLIDSLDFSGIIVQADQVGLQLFEAGTACWCDTTTLIIPTPPIQNAGDDLVICHQDTITLGSPTAVPTLGFSWQGIGGAPLSALLQTNSEQTQAVFTNLTNSPISYSYELLTTQTSGITTSDTVTVEIRPIIEVDVVPDADYNGQDISCAGAADGALQINVENGIWPYTYFLEGQEVPDSILTGLGAGTYMFTVVDAVGCSQNVTFSLAEPDSLQLDLFAQAVSCSDSSDGSVSSAATGGTPPYTYAWAHDPNIATPTLQNVPAGTYTLTLTDLNGCTIVESIEVDAPIPTTATLELTPTTCHDSADGTATLVDVINGTPPYTYLWENGQTDSLTTMLAKGFHQVSIQDTNGCISVIDFEITGPESLIIANTGITGLSCSGATDATIAPVIEGGTMPYTIAWSTGVVQPSLEQLSPGTYSFTVTDANDCQLISPEIDLDETSSINIIISNAVDIDCFGAATGSFSVGVQNGTPPYFYSINGGPVQGSPVFSNLVAGTYTIAVRDNLDCEQTIEYTLTEPALLSLALSTQSLSCIDALDGQVAATVDGGVLPYTFEWDNGADDLPDSALLNGIHPGWYTLLLTDANGCTLQDSILLTAPDAIRADIDLSPTTCHESADGSATLLNVAGGTPPYSYLWEDAQMDSLNTTLSKGLHQVTIEDANQCTTVIDFEIMGPESLVIDTIALTDLSCSYTTDGAIVPTIQGGTAPYEISWNTGVTQAALTQLEAGVYAFTVTDVNGCQVFSPDLELTQPAPIAIALTNAENIACFGENTGALVVAVQNGVPPLTYSINGGAGQSSPIFENLAAGMYTITVSDSRDCQASIGYELTEPTPLTLDLAAQGTICANTQGGQVTATVSGGVTPYQFEWNNSNILPNSPTLNDVNAGWYTLLLTDANGCTLRDSILVEAANQIMVELTLTPTTCHESTDGTATLFNLAGGNPPFTYLWEDGQTDSLNTMLAKGFHQVTIEDANQCGTVVEFEITGPAPLVIDTIIRNDLSCSYTMDGAISPVIQGGTTPYEISWNTGVTQASLEQLEAGSYAFTVTDANGCQTTSADIEIAQPAAIEVTITDTIHINCAGEATGALTVSVQNGIPPLTYSINGGTAQSSPIFENLSAGAYTIVVSDSQNCQASITYELTEPAPLTLALSAQATSCANTLDGQVSAVVDGGVPPYQLEWNETDTLPNSATLDAIPPGWYTLLLTDANGCTLRDSILVEAANVISAELALTPTNCHESTDGTATLFNLAGGNPPFTYLWEDGQTDSLNTMLSKGFHQVTIEDANQCATIIEFEITGPEPLEIDTILITDLSCSNSLDGAISPIIQGGTAPYEISWNTGVTQASLEQLGAGTYTFTVTDANDCQLISPDIAIAQPQAAGLSITGVVDIDCFGAATGAFTVAVENGTPPFVYTLVGGAPQSNPTFENLSAGSYTIEVSDSSGCGKTIEYTLPEPAPLTIAWNVQATSCFDTADGQVEALVSGGTAPYAFMWNNTDTLPDTPLLEDLAPGWYTLSLTDANDCSLIDSIFIDAPAPITANLELFPTSCHNTTDGTALLTNIQGGSGSYQIFWQDGQQDTINTALAAGAHSVRIEDSQGCSLTLDFDIEAPEALAIQGATTTNLSCYSTIDGTIEVLIEGGTAPYSYIWSNTDTTAFIRPLDAGSYTLTVTDANGCQLLTPPYEIVRPDSLILAVAFEDSIACQGAATASVVLSVTNGAPPYLYQVNASTPQASPIFDNLSAGDYLFSVTDGSVCTQSLSYTINEPTPLAITFAAVPTSCADTADGMLSANVSGGRPPYSYSWNTGPTVAALSDLAAAFYTLTVTDANGCSLVDTAQVEAPLPLEATATTSPASCFEAQDGQAVIEPIVGGTPPYTILWEDGLTLPTRSDLSQGSYDVQITDSNGCKYFLALSIDAPPILALSQFQRTDLSCFEANDGQLAVSIEGGTPPYTYLWSNSATEATLTGLAAGSYFLTVIDQQGCRLEDLAFELTQPEALELSVIALEDISCFGAADGLAELEAAGGVPPYSYEWSSGQSSAVADNLAPGTYEITLTDATDCTISTTFSITQPMPLEVSTNITSPGCNGDPASIEIIPTLGGGTPPYLYSIDNGQTYSDSTFFDGLELGTYPIQVIDANGCVFFEEALISPAPPIDIRLPKELVINFGEVDSIQLEVFDTIGFTSIEWTPADSTISCTDCFSPSFSPPFSTQYQVTIIDGKACIGQATLPVFVQRPRRLFIPNAFSPNGDDNNDVWTIFGAPEVVQLEQVLVFNRWGSLVFERKRIPHSDASLGWDGLFDGRELPGGVYVYLVEALFTDGERKVFKGDVVLMR